MKLKCDRHGRRVMRLAPTHFTHREDGSRCESRTASIGTNSFGSDAVAMHVYGPPGKGQR